VRPDKAFLEGRRRACVTYAAGRSSRGSAVPDGLDITGLAVWRLRRAGTTSSHAAADARGVKRLPAGRFPRYDEGVTGARGRDYFDVVDWVREAMAFVAAQPLLPGNFELAAAASEDFVEAGLCRAGSPDWCVLTNRLAARGDIGSVDATKLVHLRADELAREAILRALSSSTVGRADIGELGRLAGLAPERVKSVFLNMLDANLPRANLGRSANPTWLEEYIAEFGSPVQVGLNRRSFIGALRGYPHEPLLDLYDRVDGPTVGGAAGRVSRHRLRARTTWGQPGTEVAIKLMPEMHLARLNGGVAQARERVMREFTAGFAQTSPRLARSYDLFVAPVVAGTEGPEPIPHYGIAMEWLDGVDLGKAPPVDIGDRIHRSVELAEAVRELHVAGIVHRDVKPDNAKLTSRGVVLMDYGISKDLEAMTVTKMDDKLFTERYASPEQMNGEAGELRDDIYALGISIFELVVGETPYPGRIRIQIFREKSEARPIGLERVREQAPALADLLGEMTASPRALRPRAEVVVERLRALEGRSADELRGPPPAAPPATSNQLTPEEAAAIRLAHFRGEGVACPRCGARVRVNDSREAGRATVDVFIHCPGCGARGRGVEAEDRSRAWSPDEQRELERACRREGGARCGRDDAVVRVREHYETGTPASILSIHCPACGRYFRT
jgi:serine/threonine protein kinase